jgi:hypothetical protein
VLRYPNIIILYNVVDYTVLDRYRRFWNNNTKVDIKYTTKF